VISFVLLSLPIFGVVALGWAAVRLRVVVPGALDTLGAFSFRFGLPALVLPLIANQPIRVFFNLTFYGGYLASGACVFALVLVLSRTLGRQNLSDAGARATTATVSNLGFLGLPLLLAFFGNRAAGPLAMAILAEVMVLLPIGCVLMSAGQREGASVGRLVLRGTLLNPVVAALLVGAALAAADLALPGPVTRFLTFLGGAAGPTALFALGGALAAQHLDRRKIVAASGITAAKLLLYPVVVWLVLDRLLGVEPIWVQAGVLLASLSSAGNIYVLAQRYDADPETVSATIALTTIVNVVSMPLAAWIMLR
jgi:malonate transporter and related proteins